MGLPRGDVAEANYQIDIPCRDPNSHLTGVNMWGLFAERTERYWLGLMALPPGHPRRNYQMLSHYKTCNGAVVGALAAGLLGAYAPLPSNYIYQGARSLLDWAKAAAKKIRHLNIDTVQLFSRLRELPAGPVNEVPSLADWKKMSYAGRFAGRKEQIALIDQLLPQYHQFKESNPNRAMGTLITIQKVALHHLTTKPTSDRRNAVLELARRLLHTVNVVAAAPPPVQEAPRPRSWPRANMPTLLCDPPHRGPDGGVAEHQHRRPRGRPFGGRCRDGIPMRGESVRRWDSERAYEAKPGAIIRLPVPCLSPLPFVR